MLLHKYYKKLLSLNLQRRTKRIWETHSLFTRFRVQVQILPQTFIRHQSWHCGHLRSSRNIRRIVTSEDRSRFERRLLARRLRQLLRDGLLLARRTLTLLRLGEVRLDSVQLQPVEGEVLRGGLDRGGDGVVHGFY